MRLILVMLLGVFGVLALKGAPATGVDYAPSSSAFAVVSSGHISDVIGGCCNDNGKCRHDRCEGDACACSSCPGAGAAIDFAPVSVLGRQIAAAYSMPVQTELFHDGLTVCPITGPPRLFG
jgi:hypothetical protein